MVYRRFCHDRLHHLRSYFRFCSGHGASQQFFLSTNGIGILPTVVNLILGLVFLLAYGTFRSKGYYIGTLLHYLAYYNVALAVYNVLPVAPMDCTKVLAVLLPANQYFKYMQNEKLIQMLFLFLLFFGMITGFMDKIIYAVLSLFGGMIGLM